MRLAVFLAVCALAGCGIDGPPAQPEGGIAPSDEARVGVVGSL
jgi:predicted small lipoprotein YifL